MIFLFRKWVQVKRNSETWILLEAIMCRKKVVWASLLFLKKKELLSRVTFLCLKLLFICLNNIQHWLGLISALTCDYVSSVGSYWAQQTSHTDAQATLTHKKHYWPFRFLVSDPNGSYWLSNGGITILLQGFFSLMHASVREGLEKICFVVNGIVLLILFTTLLMELSSPLWFKWINSIILLKWMTMKHLSHINENCET